MVVYRDESLENALVNNVHYGKATSDMVFPVFQQDLCCLKLFNRDNCIVSVLIQILVSVLVVFLVFVFI